MHDYDVKMRFAFDAGPEAVRRLWSGVDGVAAWWSDRVEGSAAEPGDRFRVSFPDAPAPFELEVARADAGVVEWRVGRFPESWAGTTIRLEVAPDPEGPGSVVHFTHGGFDSANPVIPIVTPVWAQVMMRLGEVARGDAAGPFFAGA